MWPELKKAKNNATEIEKEIAHLLKKQNGFWKKEIARHDDMLLDEVDVALDKIDEEVRELKKNLLSHRKYVTTKSRFLKRHYKYL